MQQLEHWVCSSVLIFALIRLFVCFSTYRTKVIPGLFQIIVFFSLCSSISTVHDLFRPFSKRTRAARLFPRGVDRPESENVWISDFLKTIIKTLVYSPAGQAGCGCDGPRLRLFPGCQPNPGARAGEERDHVGGFHNRPLCDCCLLADRE